MCLRIFEILLLLGGLYALIAGKIRLTKNMFLEGRRARIAGLFLVAPLPLIFLIGMAIGLSSGPGGISGTTLLVAGIIEILLVFGGLVGAVIFAMVTKPRDSGEVEEAQQPPSQA